MRTLSGLMYKQEMQHLVSSEDAGMRTAKRVGNAYRGATKNRDMSYSFSCSRLPRHGEFEDDQRGGSPLGENSFSYTSSGSLQRVSVQLSPVSCHSAPYPEIQDFAFQCSESAYRSRVVPELKQQEIYHVIVNKKV